jgi:uncharacterized protein (DUF58 family)
MTDLLDADFLRELEVLRRRLQVRARSGAAGEQVARRRGGSAEFHEHRAYAAGDDLRRVDWLAFARSGTPVVKLFRAEEDVIVRLVLDASASLGFGDPQKLEVARRLTAAVAYLALAGSQRAQLWIARERERTAFERVSAARRGRGGLGGLLRELAAVEPAGSADLARAVDQAVRRSRRPGLFVVVSDFFDSGPVTSALGRARAAGHDVALLQVLAREEVEPALEGDLLLEDAETTASVEVTVDARAIEAYVLRLTGLVEELRAWARRHGATYVRTLTDEPLEGVVRRLVARAVD